MAVKGEVVAGAKACGAATIGLARASSFCYKGLAFGGPAAVDGRPGADAGRRGRSAAEASGEHKEQEADRVAGGVSGRWEEKRPDG